VAVAELAHIFEEERRINGVGVIEIPPVKRFQKKMRNVLTNNNDLAGEPKRFPATA